MNSELPALSIKGLTKAYDNGFQALKGVDLDVMPGDFFALLGPNGAGKSTIIGIISSLVRKSSGSVSVFGHDIDKDFPRAKKDVGVVPQEFNFNQFEKVFDIVVTQAGYYGLPRKVAEQRTEKYLRRLGLWDKQDQRSRMLSGGMKRRLMIARALVHEPRLLILDEPTAGVDIELRRSLWDFLREINEQGTTIILTTHYLEEAESLCRRIAIIDQGLINHDTTTRELLAQLTQEVFVIDTREALENCPQLDGYSARLIGSHSFEVVVEKGQSLNDLFVPLTAQGIHVSSLRNKANRLEELFMSLVNGGPGQVSAEQVAAGKNTSALKEAGQ
jgi:ABC-2 type transport system ATP-binding protein